MSEKVVNKKTSRLNKFDDNKKERERREKLRDLSIKKAREQKNKLQEEEEE